MNIVRKFNIFTKELYYFLTEKFPSLIKAKIYQNGIYAYWGKYINFGDQLTPLLLRYYGLTPMHAHYKPSYGHQAELVCIGTLLNGTPKDFSGYIFGTGMDELTKEFPNAVVLGVRGKLTQKNLGLENSSLVLGDPGLLVSYIFPEKLKKEWVLGIIPHFFDKNEKVIESWKNKFNTNVKFIDVQRSPEVVISEIKKCQYIISSSLHGLITADAFDIPNAMFAIRTNKTRDDYKYLDYYSTLGIEMFVIEATGDETLEYIISKTSSKGNLVEEMKQNLNREFLKFSNLYKKKKK